MQKLKLIVVLFTVALFWLKLFRNNRMSKFEWTT